MKIERFEDIEIWQLARELTRKVYRLTKKTRVCERLRAEETFTNRKVVNRELLNRKP